MQKGWNDRTVQHRQYNMRTFLVQTKHQTRDLSIRHFQFVKESMKSNLLKIKVCVFMLLNQCVLARSSTGETSSSLALLRTDDSPTARPAHRFNMF